MDIDLCTVDTGCWPFSVTSLAEILHGATYMYMYFLGLNNKKFGMFAILFYIGLFMRDFKEVL